MGTKKAFIEGEKVQIDEFLGRWRSLYGYLPRVRIVIEAGGEVMLGLGVWKSQLTMPPILSEKESPPERNAHGVGSGIYGEPQ